MLIPLSLLVLLINNAEKSQDNIWGNAFSSWRQQQCHKHRALCWQWGYLGKREASELGIFA